jgi:hypothetical protein
MRKIDEIAARCFFNRKRLKKGNTWVLIHNKEVRMYLYKHCIAKTENGEIWINHCGWPTITTRNRLNGLGADLQLIQKRKDVKSSKLIYNNQIMLEGWHKL